MVEYGTGDLAAAVITWGLPPGVTSPHRLDDVLGPRGVLAPGRPQKEFTVYLEGEEQRQFGPYLSDPQLELTRDVIRAVREGTLVQATARDGRAALAVSWAALMSWEKQGQPVLIPR